MYRRSTAASCGWECKVPGFWKSPGYTSRNSISDSRVLFSIHPAAIPCRSERMMASSETVQPPTEHYQYRVLTFALGQYASTTSTVGRASRFGHALEAPSVVCTLFQRR